MHRPNMGVDAIRTTVLATDIAPVHATRASDMITARIFLSYDAAARASLLLRHLRIGRAAIVAIPLRQPQRRSRVARSLDVRLRKATAATPGVDPRPGFLDGLS